MGDITLSREVVQQALDALILWQHSGIRYKDLRICEPVAEALCTALKQPTPYSVTPLEDAILRSAARRSAKIVNPQETRPGWKLVPITPTQAMLETVAGVAFVCDNYDFKTAWAAALSAV